MKARTLLAGLLLGLFWPLAACADGEHVFWEVTGKHNTVYLLGSIHLLPGKDRELPAVADAAYRDAETIIEEIDVFASGAELASTAMLNLQRLPEGKTLDAVLGPMLHARLHEVATPLRINVDSLARTQPWYVALTVIQAQLAQAGLNSADGVDYQIALRAQRDRKPLRGLETAVEQLSIFAGMSLADQAEFLRATLEEPDIAAEVTQIAAVWRRGDLKQLEALLRSGAEESPEFFKQLTTDRNLRWLPQIEAMLADPKDDYLVVTGALHMVGDMGLVELLRRKGYKIKRR